MATRDSVLDSAQRNIVMAGTEESDARLHALVRVGWVVGAGGA